MPTKKSSTPQNRRPASGSETKKSAKPKTKAAQTSARAPEKPARRPAEKPVPEPVARPEPNPDRLLHQIIPYILVVAAIFLLVCFILTDAVRLEQPMGVVGHALRSLLCGLWGWSAFYIPLILLYIAIIWRRTIAERTTPYKISFALICLTLCSALIETFAIRGRSMDALLINPLTLWREGCALRGGGVFGGWLGQLCYRGFGFVGTLIVIIALLLVFLMFFFGLTPSAIVLYIRYALKVRAEKRAARAGQPPLFLDNQPKIRNAVEAAETEQKPTPSPRGYRKPRRFEVDVPVGTANRIEDIDLPIPADLPESAAEAEPDLPPVTDADAPPAEPDDNPIDPAIFDEVLRETMPPAPAEPVAENITGDVTELVNADLEQLRPTRGKPSVKKIEEIADEELDLHKIFTDPSTLDKAAAAAEADAARRRAAGGESAFAEEAERELLLKLKRTYPFNSPAEPAAAPEPPPKPEYVFPPISLLKVDPAPPSGDVRAELQQNAEKLVETLGNFKVRTKIVNVSRGPTITRYELQPEAGTRVRAIANLVDDIALNLATTGVRIEAPIPGKAAVGIEVPNKVVATVYARELLEADAFRNAKSRLTACLGRDVAGAPIYCDIAKMPHLLIAGTTGSGKSVCINSVILSILYKAKPDEVKLILIDPKKVELNVYNGIPHLLVPVVSDPKKAAGSLNWAVSEMERRYALIEAEGVRNIQGYNEAIADDPTREPMHQIVIVIDELADLMMMAKDDVETSICRIAQKARAAGMHLVIGTQRPSVDVITGLIKANIPSRIAFTVSQQVDSRTILDMAGAEKLIGRGDMLYAPVGATRPIRVQGAFVSDGEVEAVTDFIKKQASGEGYSEEIIESIEREAARCGQSKKGGSSLDDADDVGGDEPADPMLRPAIELAIECGKISTSLIQRRLSLGYGRAAKLIDRMERLGYVSAPDGQKPRDVLITRQQFMEMVVRDDDIG
ncbi:MAG: DNA translocase FtsK 4TM domain-containing protein [Clostridia bacterium]|nr:DNA translocase FtsK 4TM domain-containing protein [Clostridia bacterium]